MSSMTVENFGQRRVERALHELRAGYPVLLLEKGSALLVLAAETVMDKAVLPQGSEGVRLVLPAVRLEETGHAAYELHLEKPDAKSLKTRIDPSRPIADTKAWQATGRMEIVALELAKLAKLIPALLVANVPEKDLQQWAATHHILSVEAEDIREFHHFQAESLQLISEARVPLAMAENARVLAFRPKYGEAEHLAIVIGEPEKQAAPLVRVHSSCVTGDILGSLRCDCGDQLKEALARIAQDGHGVLLYLEQEGRGIGIGNKLRAYGLQDAGMDTVEANEALGFAADERYFEPAASMLKSLAITHIRLLTNNPQKVQALERLGIVIMERVGLVMPISTHNRQYLETKEKRCGHIF